MNAFREVADSGVSRAIALAAKHGYRQGDPEWCNLGQGQPETGPLEGAPVHRRILQCLAEDQPYGPVAGLMELRRAVAGHYNDLYRGGQRSKYTAENVAIVAGGRLALARVLAALDSVRLGVRTPDYAGYAELLASHRHRLDVVPVVCTEQNGYLHTPDAFAAALRERRLDAYLFSNPCNPTGQLARGETLRRYLEAAKAASCTLLIDEFYSHYIYEADGSAGRAPQSAARFVEDVNADAVMLIDGLTKNFRRPGWRLAWIVGPARFIEGITRIGAALDGGPSTIVQRAAIDLLEPARIEQETSAVRRAFAIKRSVMLEGLAAIGIRVPQPPVGTFYVWGDVGGLPASLADADRFAAAALAERVIVIPGPLFDLQPLAEGADALLRKWVRFSFGPDRATVQAGLARLRALV